MGRRGRVYHEALDISHVSQQREELQVVDELPGRVFPAFYLESEYGAASVREIFLVEGMVWMRFYGRVVDFLHFRIILKIFHDLQGVFCMAFDSERQGLKALDEYPCAYR